MGHITDYDRQIADIKLLSEINTYPTLIIQELAMVSKPVYPRPGYEMSTALAVGLVLGGQLL